MFLRSVPELASSWAGWLVRIRDAQTEGAAIASRRFGPLGKAYYAHHLSRCQALQMLFLFQPLGCARLKLCEALSFRVRQERVGSVRGSLARKFARFQFSEHLGAVLLFAGLPVPFGLVFSHLQAPG